MLSVSLIVRFWSTRFRTTCTGLKNAFKKCKKIWNQNPSQPSHFPTFTHGRSLQKAAVSESLPSLFTKEWPWANCSRFLLKRAMSVIRANRSQKTSHSLEKSVFFVRIWQFFHLFRPKEQIAPVVLCVSELIPSIFKQALFSRITGLSNNST